MHRTPERLTVLITNYIKFASNKTQYIVCMAEKINWPEDNFVLAGLDIQHDTESS